MEKPARGESEGIETDSSEVRKLEVVACSRSMASSAVELICRAESKVCHWGLFGAASDSTEEEKCYRVYIVDRCWSRGDGVCCKERK